MILTIEKGIKMKEIFSVLCGFFVLVGGLIFVGCDDNTDYMEDYSYTPLERPELTGETGYDFQIVPDEARISPKSSFQLYATGGTKPYGDWIVSVPDLGTVNSSDVYIAGKYTGTNVVSITDASGNIASITIIVE